MTAAFWDGMADRYAARPIDDPDAYQATLDRVQAHLDTPFSVLELGCGTGTTALHLYPHVVHYRGTDLSPEMIRIARDRAAQVPQTALRFSVSSLGATTGTWNAVLAFNLLHLVDDLPAALAHIRSLLPPGGLFLGKTPCLKGKPWLRLPIWGLQVLGKAPSGVRFLGPPQLQALVKDAGFEILETGEFPASLPNHFIAARAV